MNVVLSTNLIHLLTTIYSLTTSMDRSVALPDCHSGYGFTIGNVAAFDMADPDSIVSPGGVGFDINCGVRLLRTNLTEVQFDNHTFD